MPPNTLKVDRKSGFGNPFKIEGCRVHYGGMWRDFPDEAAARADSIRAFRDWVAGCDYFYAEKMNYRLIRKKLRGKNLACWCALPKDGEPDLCHAAVLLELANR